MRQEALWWFGPFSKHSRPPEEPAWSQLRMAETWPGVHQVFAGCQDGVQTPPRTSPQLQHSPSSQPALLQALRLFSCLEGCGDPAQLPAEGSQPPPPGFLPWRWAQASPRHVEETPPSCSLGGGIVSSLNIGSFLTVSLFLASSALCRAKAGVGSAEPPLLCDQPERFCSHPMTGRLLRSFQPVVLLWLALNQAAPCIYPHEPRDGASRCVLCPGRLCR